LTTVATSTTILEAVVPAAHSDGGEDTPPSASDRPAGPRHSRSRHRLSNVLLDGRIGRPPPVPGVVPSSVIIIIITTTTLADCAMRLGLRLVLRIVLLLLRAQALRLNSGGTKKKEEAVPLPELDARLEPVGGGPREAAKESLALRSRYRWKPLFEFFEGDLGCRPARSEHCCVLDR
jgi:hypothetical protein